VPLASGFDGEIAISVAHIFFGAVVVEEVWIS